MLRQNQTIIQEKKTFVVIKPKHTPLCFLLLTFSSLYSLHHPSIICQWRSNTDLEGKRAVWKMSRGERKGLVWRCIAGAKRWAIYKSSCGQNRGVDMWKEKREDYIFLNLFVLYIVVVFAFLGYRNTEMLRNSVLSRKWSKNCEKTMSRHFNDLKGSIPVLFFSTH